jgi:hypothetical protein
VADFDPLARTYQEADGPAASLLAYRLALLRCGYAVTQDAVSPEIGCGTGIHLLAVASELIDQRQRFVGDDLLQLIFRRAGARHIGGTCLCRNAASNNHRAPRQQLRGSWL